jgi:hypothetical protein
MLKERDTWLAFLLPKMARQSHPKTDGMAHSALS